MTDWVLSEAVEFCRHVEAIAPTYGCHVAMTGGVLYKGGPRKDLDLVLYRIRDRNGIDVDGLFKAMESIGVRRLTDGEKWCVKAERSTVDGRSRRSHVWHVDFFFPEHPGHDYPPSEKS